MSFLFDNLFQKQNPELASQMAKRGLIFDRIKHRWVRKPENRAQPTTAPGEYFSGSEILTGEDGSTHSVKYMRQGTKMNSPVLVYLEDKPYKQFSHFKDARMSMRLEIAGGVKRTTHPASIQKKWKRGERVEDKFKSAPMGIGKNSFVVVPGKKVGTADVVGVDKGGYIISWFIRGDSVKDAMKWFKEHSKPKGWEPEPPEESFYTLENEKLKGRKLSSYYYF